MQQAVKAPAQDRRLTIAEVIDWLVEDGLVDAESAEKLRKERRYYRGSSHPLVIIADQKWKSAQPPHRQLLLEPLTEWLAKRVGMQYLHIDPLKIDFGAVTEVMSSAYATRFRVLPVGVSTKEVVIATAEPWERAWERELQPILKREIRRVIANPADIERYQVEFYNLAKSVKGAARGASGASGLSNFEQLVELGASQQAARCERCAHRPGRRLAVELRIRAARERHPHRAATRGGNRAFPDRRRAAPGVPDPVGGARAMTSRIKILGRMDVVEKRRPQDGRIKTRTLDGAEVELRLSTLPTAFGEKLVMRIFDPEVLVRDFKELGFSDEDHSRWKEMTERPNGIVLVTGPTGSGKTTTLYSTLKQLATPEVNVCTIEDPIEMVEGTFNQMQVHHAIDLGFAEGVRALMRQDPDIIMVGEIRDLETAGMAVQAALTGHLVLSTLHTNDAPSAVTRLLELGVAAVPSQCDAERSHGAAPGAHAVPALQGQGRRRPHRG
jgi:general secretion pathway protein E